MIKKFVKSIQKIEMIVCMLGLCVLTLCLFIGAVARTIGRPLSWTTDIGMLMLAWSTFLGGDIAFRKGRLSNLDALVSKFPLKLQKLLVFINYSIIIFFLGIIVYYGFKLTWSTRFRTFNGVPNFSYSYVTVAMPITAILMIFTAIMRCINALKSDDKTIVAKM